MVLDGVLSTDIVLMCARTSPWLARAILPRCSALFLFKKTAPGIDGLVDNTPILQFDIERKPPTRTASLEGFPRAGVRDLDIHSYISMMESC